MRRLLLVVVLLASVVVLDPLAPDSAAQADVVAIELWGVSDGQVVNPKEWKYRASTQGDDLGSATAADPDLDDSAWVTKTIPLREIPGPYSAHHWRKDFDLAEVGVEPFQVVGMRVQVHYDDTAVMYLNGTEVYRSVRGNLDPNYVAHPLGTDIPYNVDIPFGGIEENYISIPDPGNTNVCESGKPDVICSLSPYGSAQPPAIPVDLLVEGVNTWGITVWNQNGLENPNGPIGGSGDIRVGHVFEILVDENAVPPATVFLNESMASNDTAYTVQLDDDPQLESPDWFELRNTDPDDATDIGGWTISDDTKSWEFPAGTTVPAGGYLVVAATGNDDATTTPMQTNFKLSGRGDALKLVTAGGVVVNELVWTDQFTDNSFGLVGNEGEATYLEAPTPGTSNDVAALTSAPPILRLFRDRAFNPGEIVDLQVAAFDPDGDSLTYSLSPLPVGVAIDASTGAITGTAAYSADITTRLTVTDSDNDTDFQDFTWTAIGDPAAGGSPLVLNEYNAVPADGELGGGSVVGNGGDWFEFLVIEDHVDLRGYSIEFSQRDADTDLLRVQTVTTFGDHLEFAGVPAGTLITISEENVDDLSFDGDQDWAINLQITNEGAGTYFTTPPPTSVFNSTRRDQTVLIKNSEGQVVTPLSGETDAWDAANGGVGPGEVFNLCRSMVQGDTIDPVVDYLDNSSTSTFGEPNICVFLDPADPATPITQIQDLTALRSSAGFGHASGDVNCSGEADIVDALLITRFEVGNEVDTGPCLFNAGGVEPGIAADAGDFDSSGSTDIRDALLIARCSVGIVSPLCPEVLGNLPN